MINHSTTIDTLKGKGHRALSMKRQNDIFGRLTMSHVLL
jgi:hypothetical protein